MTQPSRASQFFKLIILLEIIAIIAVAVWYAPIAFKGYSTVNLWSSALLARNLAQQGVFGAENERNIFLASSLIEDRAQPHLMGNKFTPIAIAQVFKLIGVPKYENLIFVSIAILALALLIFTVTVYHLFNLKTAVIFALIYIFLPFNWWQASYNFAVYEVGIFLLSLFSLFFFLGLKSEFKREPLDDFDLEPISFGLDDNSEKTKGRYLLLILSGIFLALAGITKEVMLVVAPVLFLYLLFRKKIRYLLCLFIPFFIIISIFWLPGMVSGKNSYTVFMFGEKASVGRPDFLNWDFLTHIYPDPYAYYFNRQEFLNEYRSEIYSIDLELITKTEISKTLTNMGMENPSLMERFKIGSPLLFRHITRFLAFEEIGGPLIFLLLIFGFIYLRREDKYLYRFFVFWIIFVLLFLAYVLIGGRSHLIDFGWAIALIVALGLLFLIDIFAKYFDMSAKKKAVVSFLLVLLVLYSLVLSGHVLWGRKYDEPHHLKILAYAEKIGELEVADQDVIAIGLGQFKISKLNYLTDKSMVVFAPETIEKLIKKEELQTAFNEFGVKYILGYSDELTKEILVKSEVINIASDSLVAEAPKTSRTKAWFMNLVR